MVKPSYCFGTMPGAPPRAGLLPSIHTNCLSGNRRLVILSLHSSPCLQLGRGVAAERFMAVLARPRFRRVGGHAPEGSPRVLPGSSRRAQRAARTLSSDRKQEDIRSRTYAFALVARRGIAQRVRGLEHPDSRLPHHLWTEARLRWRGSDGLNDRALAGASTWSSWPGATFHVQSPWA